MIPCDFGLSGALLSDSATTSRFFRIRISWIWNFRFSFLGLAFFLEEQWISFYHHWKELGILHHIWSLEAFWAFQKTLVQVTSPLPLPQVWFLSNHPHLSRNTLDLSQSHPWKEILKKIRFHQNKITYNSNQPALKDCFQWVPGLNNDMKIHIS